MVQLLKKTLAERTRLDPRLALFAMLTLAAVFTAVVVIYLWRDNSAYRPLYGSGEAFNTADVIELLEADAIGYRLHPESGQVLVHNREIARARMLLAAKGVEVTLPAGYELFDVEQPLGISKFEQEVRLKRSLEGELSRSIMTIKGVDAARVHLALEDKSTFVLNRAQASKASVMLQLASGQKLEAGQVSAIVNLVANSVPELAFEDVSVVDQHGVLLSRGLTEAGGAGHNWEVVDEYQNKTARNIEQVLAPVFGAGNFRISVAADMDFSQREQTTQTYGENPRLRSEITRDKSVLDELALGVPGSLSNTPPPRQNANEEEQAEGDDANPASTSLSKEANRTLDYDQTVMHIKHAPFALKRQTISVVLNADPAAEGSPWNEAARGQVMAMVRSAVAFDEARGDELTLSLFPFAPVAAAPAPAPWWQTSQTYELARVGLLGLFALVLVLAVVRPTLKSLVKASLPALPEAQPQPEAVPLRDGMRDGVRDGALERELPQGRPAILGELNPLSEILLPAPDSGLELQIEHLQMLARNDAERVSEVIKQWIGRNEKQLS